MPRWKTSFPRLPLRSTGHILCIRNNGAPGTNPDGGPCYIKGPYDGPKTDYVFGSGPQGELYYHLMTQQSYVILYERLKAAEPTAECTCFSSIKVREEAKEHAAVSRILYYRARASIPDDVQARKDAEKRLGEMIEDAIDEIIEDVLDSFLD
jgi:hypothetical protein